MRDTLSPAAPAAAVAEVAVSPSHVPVTCLPSTRYRTDLSWADVVLDTRPAGAIEDEPLPRALFESWLYVRFVDMFYPAWGLADRIDDTYTPPFVTPAEVAVYVFPSASDERRGFGVYVFTNSWLETRFALVFETRASPATRAGAPVYDYGRHEVLDPLWRGLSTFDRTKTLGPLMMCHSSGRPSYEDSVQAREDLLIYPLATARMMESMWQVLCDPDGWLARLDPTVRPKGRASEARITKTIQAMLTWGPVSAQGLEHITSPMRKMAEGYDTHTMLDYGVDPLDSEALSWMLLANETVYEIRQMGPAVFTFNDLARYRRDGWQFEAFEKVADAFIEKAHDDEFPDLDWEDPTAVNDHFEAETGASRWLNAVGGDMTLLVAYLDAGVSVEEAEDFHAAGKVPDLATLHTMAALRSTAV